MWRIPFVLLLLAILSETAAGIAMAQQAEPSQAAKSLSLALQQLPLAVAGYHEDMMRQLASRDARIVELEKLCGEPCKPKVEAK